MGYRLRTRKGAAFRGEVVAEFLSLDGTPHVVLEATEEGFKRSLHVYPMVQLEADPHISERLEKILDQMRPFGDKGVSVPDGMGGTTTLTAEQFDEQFGNGRR